MYEKVEALRRESELVDRIICPRCGRSLLFIPGRRSITFYCKSGHDWFAADLVRTGPTLLRNGLRRILRLWKRKAQIFRSTSTQALLDGHLELAETFRREADKLEERAHLLSDALEKLEPPRRAGEA